MVPYNAEFFKDEIYSKMNGELLGVVCIEKDLFSITLWGQLIAI